jgi:hypothetical protein
MTINTKVERESVREERERIPTLPLWSTIRFQVMQHAGGTLRKIFRENVCREGTDAPMLAWPLACGTQIAERAQALSFADGVLTVAVPDETWRRQLQNFAPQYVSAMSGVTSQKVNKIEFVVTRTQQ